MKNLEPLTKEQFIEQLGLSEKVAKEFEGKKCYNTDLAMTSLLLKGEIPAEQYGEYLRTFPSPFGFDLDNMLFRYSWPKKKDREMRMPDFFFS
jgi:hypothetical protein